MEEGEESFAGFHQLARHKDGLVSAIEVRQARTCAAIPKVLNLVMVNTPKLPSLSEVPSTSLELFPTEGEVSLLLKTLDDQCQINCSYLPGYLGTVGNSFRQMLQLAMTDKRIVFGVSECSQLIDQHPEEVVLCVFAANLTGECENHIYYKLIETLCWHYDISLGMAPSDKALRSLLGPNGDLDDCDMNCILVAKPQEEELTAEEDVVVKFCRQHSNEDEPPLIPLVNT